MAARRDPLTLARKGRRNRDVGTCRARRRASPRRTAVWGETLMGTWRSPETLAKLAKAKAKRRKANLEKSAAATVKGPVVVFKSATGESNTDRKGTKVSKSKIKKATTIESAAARAAIAAAADELERYADDGQVAGLVSKLRATIDGDVVPVDGIGLSTQMIDGQITVPYAASGATKSERRFEDALTEMVEISKRDDLNPRTREAVRNARRDLQLEYLHKASQAAAAALEAQTAQSQASNAAQFVGRQVPVVGDDAEIRKAASRLRKSDSSLTEYEALERASKAARAA